jgi:hypothetical protein
MGRRGDGTARFDRQVRLPTGNTSPAGTPPPRGTRATLGDVDLSPEPAWVYEPRECTAPARGWRCTRTTGHDGPCAAVLDDSSDPRVTIERDPHAPGYIIRADAGITQYALVTRLTLWGARRAARHEMTRMLRTIAKQKHLHVETLRP